MSSSKFISYIKHCLGDRRCWNSARIRINNQIINSCFIIIVEVIPESILQFKWFYLRFDSIFSWLIKPNDKVTSLKYKIHIIHSLSQIIYCNRRSSFWVSFDKYGLWWDYCCNIGNCTICKDEYVLICIKVISILKVCR